MDLRIGFIGAGEQGLTNLLPALMQVAGAHVVAVCDERPNRATQAAKLAGSPQVYHHYTSLIEQAKPDAIVMACPPRVHREVALAAMRDGISVFVEKPPCILGHELNELVGIAQQFGVVTGVGMNFRYASAIRRLFEVTASDRFGSLVHFELRHPANKPKAPMWEAESTVRSFLLAQTIHSIDLALLIGGNLEATRAEIIDKDGGFLIKLHLQFEGGVTGSVLTGNLFPYFDFEVMAIGSRSSVVSVDKMWNVTVKDADKLAVFHTDGKRWQDAWHPSPLDSGYARSGYLGELQAFCDAVRQRSRFSADFSALRPTFDIIDLVSDQWVSGSARELAYA